MTNTAECETCDKGCDCDQRAPRAGCGHYACWGPRAGEQVRCPAADVYAAHTQASLNEIPRPSFRYTITV